MSNNRNKRAFKPGGDNITRMDFASFHYHNEPYDSDAYYVKLANSFYKIIRRTTGENDNIPSSLCKRAALVLAAHVEDFVADNKIWSSFISLYRKKYGRECPFYITDEDPTWDQEELPSLSSIRFLLWYVLNDANPDTLVNPSNEGILLMATEIGLEIMKNLDKAPETPMRPQILPESECGVPVLFQIRNLCQWLIQSCYLTRVWDIDELYEDCAEMLDNLLSNGGDLPEEALSYGIFSYLSYNIKIGPIAITPYEWLSEIIGICPEPEEKKYVRILREFESLPYGFYYFEKVNKKSAAIRTLKGEEMSLSAYSMSGEVMPPTLKNGMTMVASLIRYNGKWMINGQSLLGLPAKLYEEAKKESEKRETQNRMQYDFNLSHLGSRIGVVGSYEEYLSHFPEIKNVPKHIDDNVDMEDITSAENLIYFINDNGAVSLVPDLAAGLKIKGNKFYDKKKASQAGFVLVMNEDMMDEEGRNYLIDHKLVPDAAMKSIVSPKEGHRLFQENMKFLVDYKNRNTLIRMHV